VELGDLIELEATSYGTMKEGAFGDALMDQMLHREAVESISNIS
jgi:hypothetical protein